MRFPKLTDFNFQGKAVLVRVDFDVPLREVKSEKLKVKNWRVEDDTRIRACLPTIEYLLENGAKVILMGHLGRPEGKMVKELSLKPVAEKLEEFLNEELKIKNKKISASPAGRHIKNIKIKEFEAFQILKNLILLENLRFYPEEEKNPSASSGQVFAKKLASLGDFYVNEAFAASHREHASIVGVPKFLPHCAGFHLVKEVENLSKVLENPKRPVVFIIGGAKTETKLPIIENLFDQVDIFLLGGVVANTFMVAEPNHPKIIGKSLFDKEELGNAKRILAKEKGEKIEFPGIGKIWKIKIPTNLVIAKKENGNFTDMEVVGVGGKSGEVFNQEKMILDIGPETIDLYKKVIEQAETVVFAGPLGLVEEEKFSHGTGEVLEVMAKSKAFKVVGGGDTIKALNKFRLLSKMDFVSLGGGAMLEYLAKGSLPGIEALK